MTALCIGTFTACTTDADVLDESPSYVSFTPSLPMETSRATDTGFDNNDQIGVFAMRDNGYVEGGTVGASNYADNVPYKYVNYTEFTPMGSGIALPTDGSKLYYYAVYPYFSGAGASFVFDVETDQSSGNNYSLSDLMTAYTTVSSAAESVHLNFSHRLSKVVVGMDNAGFEAYNFTLTDVYTRANANLNARTFTCTGSRGDVIMAGNGMNSFKAILPPQTFADGDQFGYMETSGKNYTITASGNIELHSGKVTEIVVRVDGGRGTEHFSAVQVR